MKIIFLANGNKKFYLIIFTLIIFLVFFTSFFKITANDGSRVATMESLVEKKTWQIENSLYGQETVDKLIYRGHLYSTKPPVLTLMGTGIYFVLHEFFYLDFYSDNPFFNAYYWITLILIGGAYILLLIYFYSSLRWFKLDENNRLLLTAALAFCTLYLPYSVTLNNHTIAGSFIFVSFYYYLKNKFKEGNVHFNLLLSGVFAGWASVIDIPSGTMFLAVIFLLHALSLRHKKVVVYILFAVPFIVLQFIFNYIVFESFFIHYLNSNNFQNIDYWINPKGIDALNHPWPLYLFNMLFGTHGLFLYTPLLFFSFYAMGKVIKRKSEFIIESIAVLFSFLVITLFYLYVGNNYGGTAYGFRYYIPITPLFIFFTAHLFTEAPKYKMVFLMVAAISFLFSAIGLTGIFFTPELYSINTGKSIFFPLLANYYMLLYK
ncbi:hypothetical protein C4569_04155 [Candidatus Parcubacteria bacterium]|nr:MAG: hypothetical protein C4569_04155 [Candidatus Parcubacteria bacterium]